MCKSPKGEIFIFSVLRVLSFIIDVVLAYTVSVIYYHIRIKLNIFFLIYSTKEPQLFKRYIKKTLMTVKL